MKRQIQTKCPVYEEILRRDFNNSTRIEYELRQDPYVGQIFNELQSIAAVVVRPSPSRLPGFLSTSTETEFSRKELGKFEHHEVSSDRDTNSCCFSGATFIEGGRIVLADWNNACLKLLNNRGLLIHRLELPNNPWDVKPLSENVLVVTVPGEQKIYNIKCDNSVLEVESSFDTDCECWGIVPIQDKLAVTCDPWSKAPSVKLFTMDGKLLSYYQKENSGGTLFAYPEHIATDTEQEVLYVSDARKQMLIAVTLDGCVLFRYAHKQLRAPAGVTTDTQGNVYICGKESQNIHQITKEGELIRILAKKENLGNPRAISIHPDCDRFVISDVSTDECDDIITVSWQ